jgi:hypothetical protein
MHVIYFSHNVNRPPGHPECPVLAKEGQVGGGDRGAG